MSEKKVQVWRIYVVYIVFVILMVMSLVQTFRIQMEGRTNLFFSDGKKEEKLPVKYVQKDPRRGEILDSEYTPLATTVTYYEVRLDPTVIDQRVFDRELMALCRELESFNANKTAREYFNSILLARKRGNRYLLLFRKVTNEQRKKLRTFPIFSLGRLKGGLIDNIETQERKLPHGKMMRRTLGFYKIIDGEAVAVGIEGAYNAYLTGKPGVETEQKISTGWKRTGQVVKEAIEGADVITTINKDIQEVADSELEKQLKNQGAKDGSVVVMDVKTGHVKAISNLTRGKDGEYYEVYNYAIGKREVPGSTFKLATLMAALEDGLVEITDTVNAKGIYVFGRDSLSDSERAGYGKITLQTAFEKSSNVLSKVISKVYRRKPEQFIDRIKSFGLGSPLGIELKGESAPNLKTPRTATWSPNTLAWMSVGYEFEQTPLQTLAFYNAVANNGKMMRPLFVKEIRRGSEIIKQFEPVVLRPKICSDQTLRTMQECLKGVMIRGTGKNLVSSQFTIAGKTGTAVVLGDKNKYDKKNKVYQASFVGYFPAEDPIYSCIVVVSAPHKDIYGAQVSGTVFAAIANKVYASTLKYHKAINESKPKLPEAPLVKNGNRSDLIRTMRWIGIGYQAKSDFDWITASRNKDQIILRRRKISKQTIPDLKGMTAKDAIYLIESQGMSAKIKGYGKVVRQSISPGKPAYAGGVITITLEP
jgi:cell division protein FtsI (penicillin-binding protein 3)